MFSFLVELLLDMLKFSEICVSDFVELGSHPSDDIFDLDLLFFQHFDVLVIFLFQFFPEFSNEWLFSVYDFIEHFNLILDGIMELFTFINFFEFFPIHFHP